MLAIRRVAGRSYKYPGVLGASTLNFPESKPLLMKCPDFNFGVIPWFRRVHPWNIPVFRMVGLALGAFWGTNNGNLQSHISFQ